MAKTKKNDEYYDERLKKLEARRKRLAEEEKKAKESYREWKTKKIIQKLEEHSLLDRMNENNLDIFDKHFKNLSKELENETEETGKEKINSKEVEENKNE